MRIPQLFFGTKQEVSKRCLPLVRALERGEPPEKLDFGTYIESGTGDADIVSEALAKGYIEGLIMLEPCGSRDRERHFRMYPIADKLTDDWAISRIDEKTVNWFFEWSFKEPWKLTALLGQHAYAYTMRHRELLKPFLRAVLEHWDELVNVGPRFERSLAHDHIWNLPTSIQVSMGMLGVGNDWHLERYPRDLDRLIRMTLENRLTN